jgi:hypothetical protein
MEPLDEKELSSLLREWKAPGVPSSLRRKVLVRPQTWAQWLTKGTLRIPVPVALLAVIAILAVWLVVDGPPGPARTPETPIAQPVGASTLADFQPVPQLEPRIIEGSHDNDDVRKK